MEISISVDMVYQDELEQEIRLEYFILFTC